MHTFMAMGFPHSLACRLASSFQAIILLACMATLTLQSSLVRIQGSNSTFTGDGIALISFKSLLSDPGDALTSWSNERLHFCNWYGVTCGSHRHPERVTALELDLLNLRGSISPSVADLTFLKRLHLAGNYLNGYIPPELGRLSRLQHLNLSNNALEGEIPEALFCLPKLSWLNLGTNNFSGRIPPGIGRSPSLATVMLSNNSLTGIIPRSIGNLSTLTYLLLNQNSLTGPIPPSLGNCSKLISLFLRMNSLEGEIPESLSYLTSLRYFDVSYNKLSGMVPSSLYNLSSLYSLTLASNHFIGMLPNNVGHTLPRLRYLCVMENQLEGPIPPSLSNASNLQEIDLSLNKFSGLVPSNLGQLQNLSHLKLGYNRLEARNASDWGFLTSLTNCTNLKWLDLSSNDLAGNFPGSIANLSMQLGWLLLPDLQMSGEIPREIENIKGLQKLDLSNNLLSGNIPGTIGKLHNLVQLTLFGNKFSGPTPVSLGNLTQLEVLSLGRNNLQGNIPKSFINYMYLNVLDLSYNQLSGTIPSEVLSISSLTKVLDLSHNSLAGSVPSDVRKLNHLISLDISENKLSGKIPSALGDCVTLNYLLMEGNFFEGDIPLQLSNLKSIQRIDLSHNKLSGRIPEFFGDIGTLQFLNLSFNDFEGPVPVKGLFTNTSEFSVQGNDKLCGGGPRLLLPSCSNERKTFASLKNMLIIVMVALCLIVFPAFLCWKNYPRKRHPPQSSSGDRYKLVSYAELHKATDGFSSVNLIGVGSFGCVYKGTLDAYNKVVAVKVLNLHERGALRSYLAECEALRNIRHRNLIKIITTCSSIDHRGNDFKALVFEFVPNGSLEEWLHHKVSDTGKSRHLSLAQRLDIAIDVALALEYLHHHHGPTPIVHCDVKPSNVLIDNEMSAHLGDFGLARFLRGNNSVSTQNPSYSIALKGSIGYIAPEYGLGAKVSTHGDVYSYGILLLELLTGRRPTDDMFKDGWSLRNFVEMGFPERAMEMVDPSMLLSMENGSQNERIVRERMTECLVSMVDIGLSCSEEAPNLRLDMQTVVNKMRTIKTAFAMLGSDE